VLPSCPSYNRWPHFDALAPGRRHPPPPDANPDAAVELTKQTDPDVPPLSRRLLRSIAHATRWRAEYRTARDGTAPAAGSGVDLDPANPAA
jgi:hypothetical protein